ncbi:MAG TPA: LEA type 2 family protein [Chitinophagaceae bacterium]|jgi:LEA14-like dessication related protein|nr:LEA type 2 family protein [Chitinophagaceae bacterium]
MQIRKQKTGLWILLVVVLLAAGWVMYRNAGSGNKPAATTAGSLANNSANEAKKEAVKLTMDVASTTITDMQPGRVRAISQVVIQNPLPVPLQATRYDYTVLLRGRKVAEGSYTQPIRLPAGGKETVYLPLYIRTRQLDEANDQPGAAGKDLARYTFINKIYTDVPVAGKRIITFNLEKDLPLIRMIRMKPGDLDIGKLGLRNSGLDLQLQLTNPNSFTIRMRDGVYVMRIDNRQVLNGALQEELILPAGETVTVPLRLELRTGRALKTGWKMLFDKKDTRYQLRFSGKLVSESSLLEEAAVRMRDEGTLEDLKRSVQEMSRE